MITAVANEQIKFQHPIHHEWNKISFCQFTGPIKIQDGILSGRNTVAIDPGKLEDHLVAQDVPREWRFFTPEEK